MIQRHIQLKLTIFKKIYNVVAIKRNDDTHSTRFFFYKNTLYKNVQDEIGQKVKNVLRILPS